MFPFTEFGPFDRGEKRALLAAFIFCTLFIVLLGVFAPAKRTVKKRLTVVTKTTLTDPLEPPLPLFPDPLEKFRTVPANFSGVDFANFSYGVEFSNGKPINLILAGGQMWDDSGWFNLQDVFYKDITGDGSPEAMVRLLHLRCHGSCDGGADVIYIYSRRNGKLKNIWQYETGSYAYGCGLKSFSLGNKWIVMELFGRCANQAMDYPGPGKFMVDDLTVTLLDFDGNRFKTSTIEYIPLPTRNVKNWQPEIRIH